MRDPVSRLPRELDRVAAADDRVAGVEGDLHDRRIRRVEQRVDLFRAFDVGRRVRVERRGDTAVERPLRRLLHALRGPQELVALERHRGARLRPAGDSEADLVLVGRQHDRPARTCRGERCDRLVEERQVVAEPVLVRDSQRRERADELQPIRLERANDRLGIAPEVARRPELDPAIAEPLHGGEHLVRRDQVVAPDRPLPHAPRARRAGKPKRCAHRNRRSVSRACSYSARTARTAGSSETSATGTSHQLS